MVSPRLRDLPGRSISFIRLLNVVLLLFWGGAVGLGACRSTPQAQLYVAAAASLAQALPELNSAFTARTGIVVTPVLSSSGNLAQQIRNGAPYDVFLSADESYIDALINEGYIVEESKRIYALGALTLVVPPRLSAVRHLVDLTRPEVRRVALANPRHAPYGRAAQEALRRAGLWEAVSAKVVMGENVRQALQFVQTGNADAGIVARSLLPAPGVRGYPISQEWYTPITQVGGIVHRTPYPEAAGQFLDFLIGPEGQRILQKHGFMTPEANP